MSLFFSVVNRETVLSFGVAEADWDEDEQADLHEAMILAWKENPDWTKEQATAHCKTLVKRTLFHKFADNQRAIIQYAIRQMPYLKQRFEASDKFDEDSFNTLVDEEMEYQAFCEEFYDDLREMYNICSAGMRDAYNNMKTKGWTFSDYHKDIAKRRKEMGYKW